MFEDSLVESAALLRSRNRLPALLSVTTQCAIAVLIVSLPLLHPELIPLSSRMPVSLAPPHLPAPIPPPVQISRAVVHEATLAAPVENVAAVSRTADCACRNPNVPGPPVDAPALSGINLSNDTTGMPLGIGTAAPPGPRVSVAPSGATQKSGPTRVSSGVIAGLLIAPIRPVYPQIARLTRTEGTVVVQAIISRSGSIESASVVSGPAMLQSAALAAVRQARYRPFMLNGQPTEVQTTITVVFRMNG